MSQLPVRIARWSARHAWRAIAGWFAFVILCLGVGSHAADTEDYRVGEAGRAEAMAAEGGLQTRPTEQITIYAKSGPLNTATVGSVLRELTERLQRLPQVDSVAAPVRSKDGTVLRVPVVLKGPELDGRKNVVPLFEQTAEVRAGHPDLVVEETGSPSISKGVNDQRGKDLTLSERITLPVTLITLLVVFGSVVMAGVPMLLALSSIAAALGLSMVASHVLPDPGVGTNMIVLIGLAVGVDYTLFYLKREREERARSGGRLSAPAERSHPGLGRGDPSPEVLVEKVELHGPGAVPQLKKLAGRGNLLAGDDQDAVETNGDRSVLGDLDGLGAAARGYRFDWHRGRETDRTQVSHVGNCTEPLPTPADKCICWPALPSHRDT